VDRTVTDDSSWTSNRRQLLKLLGTSAVAAGLAGCSSGNNGTPTGGAGTSTGTGTPSGGGSGVKGATGPLSQSGKFTIDADHSAYFGRSVALSADATTALVGAPGLEMADGTVSGGAYIFEFTDGSWSQQGELLDEDSTECCREMGKSVDISPSGDTAIVGDYYAVAPNGEGRTGAAYVFQRSGTDWTLEKKFNAPREDWNNGFGNAVALAESGTTALIGSSGTLGPENNTSVGTALEFQRSGGDWTLATEVISGAGPGSTRVGETVAITESGDTALVGIPGEDNPTGADLVDLGAAEILERTDSGWESVEKLTVSAPDESTTQFGRSVALANSGDTALVGAREWEMGDVGAAYVYERAGGDWTEQKLTASDGEASDVFGYSVSLSGDSALVGARGDDDPNGSGAGSAYVFERDGGEWVEANKLAADDGEFQDSFGESVELVGDTALIGANENADGPGETPVGSMYVFTRGN